ncbi:hypothetical protein [Streptomyces sp. R41]|uniref:GNAT family N-acetyltransferase n=1 Tax=Streptomyces sp. R41 TaxID=3238632 RepID=A0AB39RMD9_9ACTN
MRHRAAAWELLGEAWPGWALRWAYDGQAELRGYLGLDLEPIQDRDWGRRVLPGPFVEPGDEELAHADPLVGVVTIGTERSYVIADHNDRPVAEGPALLDRLATAPEHGAREFAAESGVHIDLERRRVGWWLLDAQPEAYGMGRRWPGWTVEFWRDRWDEHVRAANGRFVPPPVRMPRSLAEVWEEARHHLSRAPRRSAAHGAH